LVLIPPLPLYYRKPLGHPFEKRKNLISSLFKESNSGEDDIKPKSSVNFSLFQRESPQGEGLKNY